MKQQRGQMWRSRWAAIGAAVAVTLGSGGIFVAHAVSSGASAYVAVTPCRLYDTRPTAGIGGRTKPLTAKETVTLAVRGTNGNCTIPADATGVAANVTTLDGTAESFLTIFPADAAQPNASSNNWNANQAPTPNKVDSKLAADGKLKVYNDAGTVNVIVDVVGYYEPSGTAAATGATGPAGPAGPAGTPGVGGVDFDAGAEPVSLNTTTPTVLASLTVSAPTAGFVVVAASVSVSQNIGLSTRCGISTTTALSSNALVQNTGGGGWAVSALNGGFAVPAGNTTFNLLCLQDNAGAAPFVWQPTITAVYSATRV